MVQKRMVAVCDILGFSKLVEENPLNQLIDNSLSFFRKALNYAINHVPITSETSEPPSLEDLKKQNRVGFAWFSDTVLFYSITNEDKDCRILIETIAWLLFATMSSPNTRIRAGISYGDIFIDEKNEIYVGQPLIEAFKLEQDQDWSGGCLTDSAKNHIPKDAIEEFNWYLIHYYVPLKSKRGKSPEKKLAVDWTRGIHFPETFILPWYTDVKYPSPEEMQTSSDIISKWRNTKAFYENVCKHCQLNKP